MVRKDKDGRLPQAKPVEGAMMRALMPTKMSEALGYDDFGNNIKLRAEVDHLRIERGDIHRVSGESPCPMCDVEYRLHPPVQGALWLHRGCDMLVKL